MSVAKAKVTTRRLQGMGAGREREEPTGQVGVRPQAGALGTEPSTRSVSIGVLCTDEE